MIIVNVRLTIDPEKRSEYLEFMADLVAKSLKDAGNLAYAHYQDTTNDNQYLILEHWDSQDSLDDHLKTDHLISFKNNIGNFVTEEPELLFLEQQNN
ncbi:putative quinol monooxygenase [Holzapfeliella sp. JNUCC 80]